MQVLQFVEYLRNASQEIGCASDHTPPTAHRSSHDERYIELAVIHVPELSGMIDKLIRG